MPMADLYCALYATPLAYSSTPRLWVWVRRVLERLVAPRVTVHWLEPEQKERRLYAALRAVEQLWYAQRDFEAARKGGEVR